MKSLIHLDDKTLRDIIISLAPETAHEHIEFSSLHSGESHRNMLVTIKDIPTYVFRIPLMDDSGASLEHEYTMLKLFPPGIAPEPLLLDISKTHLPVPFLVETFISGKHVKKWPDTQLMNLARTMAQVHSITAKHWGPSKKPNLVIVDYLEELVQPFFRESPELVKHAEIKLFQQPVEKFLKEKQYLFNSLKEFSLIHGDLTVNNILCDGDKIHYIDAETATFGDNAQDFATFFYPDITYHTWRIKLSKQQQALFLATYMDLIPDVTLHERIAVWHIFDKYCSLVYCLWKRENFKKHTAEGTTTMTRRQLDIEIDKLKTSLEKSKVLKSTS